MSFRFYLVRKLIPIQYHRYFAMYLVVSRVIESVIIASIVIIFCFGTNDMNLFLDSTRFTNPFQLKIYSIVIVVCSFFQILLYFLSFNNMSLGTSLVRKSEIYVINNQFSDAIRLEEIQYQDQNIRNDIQICKKVLKTIIDENVELLMINDDPSDYITQKNQSNVTKEEKNQHLFLINYITSIVNNCMDDTAAVTNMLYQDIMVSAIENCHLTVILLLLSNCDKWLKSIDKKSLLVSDLNFKVKNEKEEKNILQMVIDSCGHRSDIVNYVSVTYNKYLGDFKKLLSQKTGHTTHDGIMCHVIHKYFANSTSFLHSIKYIVQNYSNLIIGSNIYQYILTEDISGRAEIFDCIVSEFPQAQLQRFVDIVIDKIRACIARRQLDTFSNYETTC